MNSFAIIQLPVSLSKDHTMTHTGEKPHVCPVKSCAKSFSTSGNLSRHKRLHGYIEPLQCPMQGCVCTFPSNNKLVKHMKFHFGNEDVKVCLVTGCGKTFSTTGNLNRHMKAVHGCKAGAMSPEGYTCSSPARTTSTSNFSGSPNAADQWFPEASMDVEFEDLWTCAPISFSEPESTEFWNSVLEEALAVLFDEPEALAC